MSGPESDGEDYNIGGTGCESIEDVVNKIMAVANAKTSVLVVERDENFKEISRQYTDSSKITDLTGWLPRVLLDEGLNRTYKWAESFYRQNRSQY